MTPSGMRGVLNDAVSIYFLDPLSLARSSPGGAPAIRSKGLDATGDTQDQVLAIWHAITLLGEADEGCDGIERRPRKP